MFKSGSKKILATLLSTAICATILVQTVSPAFAANELNPKYTYTNGDYTFEKISHPNSPVESADGIVDYIGSGSVKEYVDGQSSGEGDRGQSYTMLLLHTEIGFISTLCMVDLVYQLYFLRVCLVA